MKKPRKPRSKKSAQTVCQTPGDANVRVVAETPAKPRAKPRAKAKPAAARPMPPKPEPRLAASAAAASGRAKALHKRLGPDPQVAVQVSRHCRDMAFLMMPFMIAAIAIGLMRIDSQRAGFGELAGHQGSDFRMVEKRALVGLPRKATALTEARPDVPHRPAAEAPLEPVAPVSEKPDPLAHVAAAPVVSPAVPADADAKAPTEAIPALPSNEKPVDLALVTPDVPVSMQPPAGVFTVPAPVEARLPVMTAPELQGSGPPAGSGTQCYAAAERPQPTVLQNRQDGPAADPEAFGLQLAKAARAQIHEFVIYNDRYMQIRYPMGDVPQIYGVCTDVIIRAYREVGIDLQELVHVTRAGSGDKNIAHRRVDTLRRFFSLYGQSLPVSNFAEDFRPGDIVSYYRPQNRHSRTHIAIVSDRYAPSGRPMIIHNRGWGPQQEDGLFVDQITGHYRFTGLRLPNLSKVVPGGAKPKKETEFLGAGQPAKKVIRASLKAPQSAAAAPLVDVAPAKVR